MGAEDLSSVGSTTYPCVLLYCIACFIAYYLFYAVFCVLAVLLSLSPQHLPDARPKFNFAAYAGDKEKKENEIFSQRLRLLCNSRPYVEPTRYLYHFRAFLTLTTRLPQPEVPNFLHGNYSSIH